MVASKITRSEEWWAKHPEVLRCKASYKSNGQQCRKAAVIGTSVCNQHGALAPAVQAKAATRIQMSVDDAVKRLQGMLDDSAVDARDKIKILHDLLDRGGLGATSKVLVGVGQVDPVERLFADILSTPGMLVDTTPVPLDPEFEQYNRDALDNDDSPVIRGELAETRSPARSRPSGDNSPAEPSEPLENASDVPPKHIRDDLVALGLM